MRMVGATILALGLAGAGPGTGAIAPAARAATVDARIDQVTVSPSAVTASGLTPVEVMVTVRLVDTGDLQDTCPLMAGESAASSGAIVELRRVTPADPRVGTRAPAATRQRLHLTGTSGTATSWTARIAVPSTWAGTWQVSRIYACADSDPAPNSLGPLINTIDLDPRAHGKVAGVTVTGDHIPALSIGPSPDPVPWTATRYVAKGRLWDTSPGAGLVATLEWCADLGCGIEDAYDGNPVTTDDAGYYSMPVDLTAAYTNLNLWIPRPVGRGFPAQGVTQVLVRGVHPRTAPAVGGVPSATRLRTGAALTVTGSFFDGNRCADLRDPLTLQYLHGRTAWRTISTFLTRFSGRFTVTVPARAGRTAYRVRYAGNPGIQAAAVMTPDASPEAPVPYGLGACVPASGRPFVVTGS